MADLCVIIPAHLLCIDQVMTDDLVKVGCERLTPHRPSDEQSHDDGMIDSHLAC